MSQTLVGVALFVGVVACIPWMVRWLQARAGTLGPEAGRAKVLSVLAVGPQQRVVTVQVASGTHEAVLVLGVTASTVNCLHKWESAGVVVAGGGTRGVVQHDGM